MRSIRRVLMVDDCVDTAETFALLLRLWGYEVCLAHDGPETLQVASEFLPDAVFLDIGLPKIDGFRIAGDLRKIRGLEDVLLVALTGFGHPEFRRRAWQAGFDDYVLKTTNPDDLRRLLLARRNVRIDPRQGPKLLFGTNYSVDSCP